MNVSMIKVVRIYDDSWSCTISKSNCDARKNEFILTYEDDNGSDVCFIKNLTDINVWSIRDFGQIIRNLTVDEINLINELI